MGPIVREWVGVSPVCGGRSLRSRRTPGRDLIEPRIRARHRGPETESNVSLSVAIVGVGLFLVVILLVVLGAAALAGFMGRAANASRDRARASLAAGERSTDGKAGRA